VRAQAGDVAACASGWEWNQNSLGQDPCTISSMLDAGCRGIGSYSIPALNSTQNYVPPQKDNTYDLTCDCNTVMYSLYMACSTCQGGMIYSWLRWITQCDSVYVTQYPIDIAPGTAVPRWAFYDVTTLPNQTYDDSVAIGIGRDPEATPKQMSTLSLKSSTSGGSSPTHTGSGNSTVSGSKTNIGAIVGGVVGGVVLLIILAVVAFIFIRRQKQSGNNQPPQTPVISEYYKGQQTSPMLSPTTPIPPYSPYYNPEDPMTYPPPVGDGHSSMTYVTPLSAHGTHGQGRFSGAPEL